MGTFHTAQHFLRSLRERIGHGEATKRLSPKGEGPMPLRTIPTASPKLIDQLWKRLLTLGVPQEVKFELADPLTVGRSTFYKNNLENMIGSIKVPVGVVGPLRVNGLHADGDYLIPLATTEAALVASYNRGIKAVNKAGGISVATLSHSVLRSPVFRFSSMLESGLFVDWLSDQEENLKQAAESTTCHGKLIEITPRIDGDLVYLILGYETGDASGQNMVTFASEALCLYIIEHCPVRPQNWYLEGNFSGDKKASFLSVLQGRGRKVTAQVNLSDDIVQAVFGVTSKAFLDYVDIANLGALMSGQVGAQAHYANGLAALFIATGQDVACVAETAVGFTRAEATQDGLKMTVTLPNLIVGTIGGGTSLPSQRAALEMMGLYGEGKANAFAEVAAALTLCGELSLTAAVAGGQFSMAHHRLARGKKTR